MHFFLNNTYHCILIYKIILTIRRLAVHSLTLFESILYFLHTSKAPNVPLGELPSSAPGLVAFVLSV